MDLLTRPPHSHPAQPGLGEWLERNDRELDRFRGRLHGSLEDEVEAHRALMLMLYDGGWSRRGWPEQAGGLGGDETARAVMYDMLSQADLPLPEAFVLLETLAPVLTRYAPDLAARHLPPYLRGEQLWGQGFSEPEAGSDLASVRTRAVSDGDELVVDGQKVWTTLGQCAQWAMVLCRTDPDVAPHKPPHKSHKPHDGLSMLWVDLAAPGVEVRPIRASNGRNEFAEMFFTGVRVPKTGVIGGLGGGWDVAMYLLQFERGMYAWGRQAALHRSLRHGLRHGLRAVPEAVAATGQAFTTLSALRSRSAETVRRLAAGETLGPEASIDKVLLSRAERQTHEALRLLSGRSFLTDDDPTAVHGRDEWFYSRATSIFGGAAEVQRTIVAERILGLPREQRGGR